MLDIRSDDRPVRDVQLDRAFLTRILFLRIGREEDCHKSVDLGPLFGSLALFCVK